MMYRFANFLMVLSLSLMAGFLTFIGIGVFIAREPQFYASDAHIAHMVINMPEGSIRWVARGYIDMGEDYELRLEKYADVYMHAPYVNSVRIMRLGDVWCIDTATMPSDLKPEPWIRWDRTVRARECPGSAFTWGVIP